MQDSIFTKIIKGEIPCHKIYEDERVIAFLDIHPSQTGHTLVVPKQQVDKFYELDEENYAALMLAVKKVARRLQDVLQPVRVGVKVEGFDVPHAHIHLVPVADAAAFYAKGDASAEPDHSALAALAEKLAF